MSIKPIVGTIGYSVSDDGVVYDQNNSICKTYKNGDGYITVAVKVNNGKKVTFGLHRLVALAHIPIPDDKDVSELTVNHIDSDITNNSSYNLEWVSVHINNIHASLMRKDVKYPTIIMTDKDGKKSFVNNLHDAAEILNMDIASVWDMVRDGIIVNGVYLEPFLKTTNIPQELRKPNILNRDVFGRQMIVNVKVKDLETGEIKDFKSLAEAAKEHNCSASHIYQCISTPKKKSLFKKRYLIVKDKEEFPNLSVEEFENLKNPGGKQTYAFNKTTGLVWVFESASSFIKTFNLSKKAISVRLKNNGYGEIENWVFSYREHKEKILSLAKSSSSQ